MPADLSRISVTAKLAAYYRQLSSLSALGLSPAWVERMRPLLRVWIMTPRSTP